MLQQIISSITPLDAKAIESCQTRVDNLTKPLNSLEGFEYIALKLAGVTGNSCPKSFLGSLILFAASNNEERNTKELIKEFCQGVLPVNILAQHNRVNSVLVDIGSADDLTGLPILHKKIAYGTNDIRLKAAMSYETAKQAIEEGIKIAQAEINKGVKVLGIGSLHADNALTSTAVIGAISQQPLVQIAENDIELQDLTNIFKNNDCNLEDAIDVLSKVGDLEIAGLVGVILGASSSKAMVILDGMAASAAALIAVRLAPLTKEYLLGSELLSARAHKIALKELQVPAYLDLSLTIGQGIGAVFGISLVRASLHMLNDMKTFAEAKVTVAQDGPGALKQTAK